MNLSLYFGRAEKDKQVTSLLNTGQTKQYPALILRHYRQLGIVQGFDDFDPQAHDISRHNGKVVLLGKMIESGYSPEKYPQDYVYCVSLDDSVGFDLPLEKRAELVTNSFDLMGYKLFHREAGK